MANMFNKYDRCPECNSDEVMDGEPSENFSGEVTITRVCLDCGFAWEENFTFSHNSFSEEEKL